MTEFGGFLVSSPHTFSCLRSFSASSSPSSLCLLPRVFITARPPSSNLLGVTSPEWGSSSNSLPGFNNSRKFDRTGEEGASQIFDIGKVSAMRLRTWCWLWRGSGAHVVRGWPNLHRVSEDCGAFDRGSSRQLYCGLLSHKAIPFGSREHLTGSSRRANLLLTCRDGPSSSSRGGGDQADSNDDGFKRRIANSTLQAVMPWNWPAFRRSLSQDVRRTREDEGDWRYSSEWWGTQAGGWGHNEGEAVFEMPSVMGNGVVSVTAHPASTPSAGDLQQDSNRDSKGLLGSGFYQVLGYEWRVLRFNNFTRQSVAKVKALATGSGDIILLQQPNCIAFEYIKTMISVGLAAVSLSGLDLQLVRSGHREMRILCIGLGGGSLPLFLAHNLPGATVEVVEIDSAVISAAIETMGFPPSSATTVNGAVLDAALGNGQGNRKISKLGAATKDQAMLWGDMLERIIVHEDDGDVFVQGQARKASTNKTVLQYDLVFVDAYDGADVVPSKLWDKSGPFLSSLSSLLNDGHGTVVVNLHTDSAPPNIFERISGNFGPGFDTTLPQGKRVQEAALAYRDVLLQVENMQFQDNRGYPTKDNPGGLAFTVAVSLQGNISLVVSRGVTNNETSRNLNDHKANAEELIQSLVGEAESIQNKLDICFDMSKRVLRGFQIVK